ncbi:hypothetical protein [Rhodohalobacter mucosus]|uniref:Negative modulator of initiation of replication SeqA N-terminal domain-containing protein n=1 Tax=Rhodohalobacter mucosus TaxID=2079485 RepID=A0A316TTZ8_9BACT|nr:hypothetical protein [Rhodohalobacter mucosus]PWN06475.1 hypothetical protein DDZ15_08105 [Rhodohalobacter mucosus]
MKYYNIEIDEEVRQYLLNKIEDFGDTPNSILRRELFQNKELTPTVSPSQLFPSLPSSIPTALQHILEVIHLVKKRGLSRVDATKAVSKRHKVRRETVLDKYGRQLDKTTSEVDSLLEDQNLPEFKRILLNKFQDYRNIIEGFFNEIIKTNPINSSRRKVSNQGGDKDTTSEHVAIEVLYKHADRLFKSKPASVRIDENEFEVNSWTEFDEAVIRWFLENGLLNQSMLPIDATSNKYFINSKPRHKLETYDGQWNKVEEGIYFDSKYNAPSHIRNILNLTEMLAPSLKHKIKVRLK